MNYVIRDGRQIEVEKINPSKPAKRKRQAAFIQVPRDWALKAAQATKSSRVMVWLELLHLAWKAQSDTVVLSNEALKAAGTSRHVKYRVLRELQAAGLITVEWRRRQAPLVTLIR